MRRQADEPELMGAHEAAKALGVQQTNLRAIRNLPEPYQKVRAGTLWRAQDIRTLAWTRLNKKAKANNNSTPVKEAA